MAFTIVPIRLFINDKAWQRWLSQLQRGRKYDKRHSIKEKKTNGDGPFIQEIGMGTHLERIWLLSRMHCLSLPELVSGC